MPDHSIDAERFASLKARWDLLSDEKRKVLALKWCNALIHTVLPRVAPDESAKLQSVPQVRTEQDLILAQAQVRGLSVVSLEHGQRVIAFLLHSFPTTDFRVAFDAMQSASQLAFADERLSLQMLVDLEMSYLAR